MFRAFCCVVIAIATASAFSEDVTQPDTNKIASLIAQLGADQFEARETAEKKLAALESKATPQLVDARNTTDPETLARINRLLERRLSENCLVDLVSAFQDMTKPYWSRPIGLASEHYEIMLQKLDRLATKEDGEDRTAELQYIRSFTVSAAKRTKIDEELKALQRDLTLVPALARASYATTFPPGDWEAAAGLLAEAVALQPKVLQEQEFVKAALKVAADKNAKFLEAFKKAGGHRNFLEMKRKEWEDASEKERIQSLQWEVDNVKATIQRLAKESPKLLEAIKNIVSEIEEEEEEEKKVAPADTK